MARIFKRGDTWYLDYRVKGKRFRKRVGKSKRTAELALKDAEVKIARDEFGFTKADISITKLVELFLDYNRTNHRESTTRRYQAVTDHFLRFLSEKKPDIVALSQLSPQVIEAFKSYRRESWVNPNGHRVMGVADVKRHTRKGARARTVNLELDGIKTMLNLAVRWGYLRENPLKWVKPLKTDDKKPVRFLTLDECRSLLDNCTTEYYPILFTFLNTGMRKAELEYLTWADVDLARRKIKIRAKEGWNPKTGEREIPIGEEVAGMLAGLKEKSKKKSAGDYVFPIIGKGRSHNWLRTELISIARNAGIRDLTKVHTLRHTFASHLVMNGVDLPTVSKLMGHSDIETTMIYAHLAPDHLAKAVTKLPFKGK
jgi:integrase